MKTAILPIVAMMLVAFSLRTDFMAEQKKHERVRAAVNEKSRIVDDKLKGSGLHTGNLNILIVAYKSED